jgi:hypothetical protein
MEKDVWTVEQLTKVFKNSIATSFRLSLHCVNATAMKKSSVYGTNLKTKQMSNF